MLMGFHSISPARKYKDTTIDPSQFYLFYPKIIVKFVQTHFHRLLPPAREVLHQISVSRVQDAKKWMRLDLRFCENEGSKRLDRKLNENLYKMIKICFFQSCLHDKGHILKLVLSMCNIIYLYHCRKWVCSRNHRNLCEKNDDFIHSFSKHNVELGTFWVIFSMELTSPSILDY